MITADKAAGAYRDVRSSTWPKRLAQIGVAAKGAVYLLVGVLAVQFARGERGDAEGTKGALASVADKPFGSILLAAIAVGLVGYVFWCIVQAISDPQGDGSDAKGLASRAGKLFKGVLYGTTAFFAATAAFTQVSGSDGKLAKWVARGFSMPFGELLVFVAGAGIIAYGVYQVVCGYKANFERHVSSEMSGRERHWL